MPWSGGVYTRGYASWVADANLNLSISAAKFDTEDNDFATGLNNCLTIDGLNKPTATLAWTQQLNLSRATDGQMASWGRTGGSNNPTLTITVTDATGVTGTLSGGPFILTGKGLVLGSPTGGDKGSGTVNAVNLYNNGTQTIQTGTFTATYTGFTTVITGTANYLILNNSIVFLTLVTGSTTGTSNSSSFTVTGLAAAVTPAALRGTQVGDLVFEDNGAGSTLISAEITSGGVINLFKNGVAAGWTSSGTKGLQITTTLVYSL